MMSKAGPAKSQRSTRVFELVAASSVAASLLYILVNRLPGLGYFDGSEYALHIEGGGIAHAPGYPLYTIFGQVFHALGANGLLAQQLISVLALGVTAVALRQTFALEVSRNRPGFAAASAVAIATLAASYYLRLFAILPEVFVLNVALYSLSIWAITRFCHAPSARALTPVFLVYGLGVCHHHTLALTLPASLYLIGTQIRKLDRAKAVAFSLAGFLIGCLPLAYLFRAPGVAETTYYRVHDLQSLLFVLLRKGYGTFHLSPLATETDLSGIYHLTFVGLLKNFNGVGVMVFAPLLLALGSRLGMRGSFAQAKSDDSAAGQYRWTSPSLLVALSALLLFLLVFVPNCNLELGVRTYRTLYFRFLTIPCFLLLYLVFKGALQAWDWASKWGHSAQTGVSACLLGCAILPALSNNAGLRYGNCDLLDEHVRQGYSAIFSQVKPAPGASDPGFHQCAIFAQGDTLLMGIKYYNELIAKQKCYVYSTTSLTGQFLSGRELRLASRTLSVNLTELESGAYATRPEALLNLFLKLDQQGYAIFVFSVTDFTGYFGKMFVNSPFAYRPVGNILQVVTQNSAPWGMDQMYASYASYVVNLETYLRKLEATGVPAEVVDSQANQSYILTLADYAKFANYYPASPIDVQALRERADVAERKWLTLMPREVFSPP